ncbi:MAG: hypothetical protein WC498_02490 [Candidatus Saccharimonadales bacterium]
MSEQLSWQKAEYDEVTDLEYRLAEAEMVIADLRGELVRSESEKSHLQEVLDNAIHQAEYLKFMGKHPVTDSCWEVGAQITEFLGGPSYDEQKEELDREEQARRARSGL